jgi:hypothetical protein
MVQVVLLRHHILLDAECAHDDIFTMPVFVLSTEINSSSTSTGSSSSGSGSAPAQPADTAAAPPAAAVTAAVTATVKPTVKPIRVPDPGAPVPQGVLVTLSKRKFMEVRCTPLI